MSQQAFIQALEETLELPAGTLNERSDFKASPAWDSLAALSIIVLVEDHFKKSIDASVLKRSNTVGELLATIAAR